MSKKNLGKRAYEYKRVVKLGSENSALTQKTAVHTKDTGHTIDFDTIKILNKEINCFKCIFIEMMNIHYHSNYMEDTHLLKIRYKKTIDIVVILGNMNKLRL